MSVAMVFWFLSQAKSECMNISHRVKAWESGRVYMLISFSKLGTDLPSPTPSKLGQDCFFFFLVIHKCILLSSFFEDIYKKLGVTKNINVLNSVIIDYFVHYQMFLANNYFLYKHSLTSRQKVMQTI